MVGTKISHYEIIEKLGEGGMGAVYKAHDLTLGRFVALKILTAAIRDSADHRARFLQEARAASSLNHPNIITIHDIVPSADDRGDSIVMEFVRGKTLDDVIASGPMPVADCLKLATQIADALAAAHGIGIVHRDLKPANVMITPEGLAKVLDFGLAKLSSSGSAGASMTRFPGLGDNDQTLSIHAASLAHTQPKTTEGSIVGTIAYMSPEQAEGRVVDTRSDIFSFGAVLYEMLSGQRAFQGTSSLAVLAAVLRDTPRDLSALRPEVPEPVLEAIASCLQKDVDLRCQSIAEVRDELEKIYYGLRAGNSGSAAISAIVPAPAARALPSIAVLPFLNLSSDKENEYFSDGLAEEIINALTRIENLKVAARTSAFAFRGTQSDVQHIGQTLHVASVLEGSVRKSGNRVRISVQLIDSAAGSNLWSERYDREMTDVFEIQDEISQNIVGKLRVKLTGPSEQEAAPEPLIKVKRFTDNMEAYNLYLKARHALYRMTRDSVVAAQSLFREAIAFDPR
jgi:serine/threonine protein kinase